MGGGVDATMVGAASGGPAGVKTGGEAGCLWLRFCWRMASRLSEAGSMDGTSIKHVYNYTRCPLILGYALMKYILLYFPHKLCNATFSHDLENKVKVIKS